MEHPILTTPDLIVNEELACNERVPTKAEVRRLITNALRKETISHAICTLHGLGLCLRLASFSRIISRLTVNHNADGATQ